MNNVVTRGSSPRRVTRIAPIVVLVALIAYALVVFAFVTSPGTAHASGVPQPRAIDYSVNTAWTTPSMPAKCSDAQITSGQVSACIVTRSFEPMSKAWGSAPFPYAGGVLGNGWKWLGWSYNGSTALKAWESQMWKNAEKVGSIRAGTLVAPPAALALFEGFLREIQANGYKVVDAGGYTFRCTSNTRKDCNGLDASSLSNHAWGLAIDINAALNPEARYSAADGSNTACSVPMTTNIPQWVVQTAEKWGLLWGGYGWSGGCVNPGASKSSVLRDPTHFEFRGTPDDAVAIAAANGIKVKRFCANVLENGSTTRRCVWDDRPQAGWRMAIPLQAISGSTAALVNVTLTGADTSGYVSAESCDAPSAGEPASSIANVQKGLDVANLAVVPVDKIGHICLYTSAPMQVIVDVQGYFLPSRLVGGYGTMFTPVAPLRVTDTRNLPYCDSNGQCTLSGQAQAQAELGVRAASVPAGSVSVLANITVTNAANPGYLVANTCENLSATEALSSNVNFAPKAVAANLAVVPLGSVGGAPGFCTTANAQSHQIVDVQGAFAPAPIGQWGYATAAPIRLLDTRQSGSMSAAGAITRVTIPAGASAALVNITLTDAKSDGYVVADKCSTLKAESTSNANMVPGRATANLAAVAVDADGSFCVYTSVASHVVVDLQGTFSPSSDLRFIGIAPVRKLDTRIPM